MFDPNQDPVSCDICRHWTMSHCLMMDSHFPYEGHLCPRFDENPLHVQQLGDVALSRQTPGQITDCS